jgi:hypothetical protein
LLERAGHRNTAEALLKPQNQPAAAVPRKELKKNSARIRNWRDLRLSFSRFINQEEENARSHGTALQRPLEEQPISQTGNGREEQAPAA